MAYSQKFAPAKVSRYTVLHTMSMSCPYINRIFADVAVFLVTIRISMYTGAVRVLHATYGGPCCNQKCTPGTTFGWDQFCNDISSSRLQFLHMRSMFCEPHRNRVSICIKTDLLCTETLRPFLPDALAPSGTTHSADTYPVCWLNTFNCVYSRLPVLSGSQTQAVPSLEAVKIHSSGCNWNDWTALTSALWPIISQESW